MKTFNWFPGHMKKTFDQIKNNLFLVDIVVMMLDARIPFSSVNFKVLSLIKKNQKPFLFLLNKKSLTDTYKTATFIKYYAQKEIPILAIDAIKKNQNLSISIYDQALKIIKTKITNFGLKKQLISNKPNIKMMIVGMPNVGKSTLINSFAGKKVLKTANLAGTTVKIQWIKIPRPNIQFLDTPGVLAHSFYDQKISLALALAGCFKDSVLPLEQLGQHALNYLQKHYFNNFKKRFNLVDLDKTNLKTINLVELIGQKRNCFTKNKQIDQNKVYQMILKEIREGSFGKINFDLDILPFLDDFFVHQTKLS